jgi:hypothetical protein
VWAIYHAEEERITKICDRLIPSIDQERCGLRLCLSPKHRLAAVNLINIHFCWHFIFRWKWLNYLEGCNSVVCQVMLRGKEIGEASHVPGTSIVLCRRYTFYNLHFSFETLQWDSFKRKHSALTLEGPHIGSPGRFASQFVSGDFRSSACIHRWTFCLRPTNSGFAILRTSVQIYSDGILLLRG